MTPVGADTAAVSLSLADKRYQFAICPTSRIDFSGGQAVAKTRNPRFGETRLLCGQFRMDVHFVRVPIDRHLGAVAEGGTFLAELLVEEFVLRHFL